MWWEILKNIQITSQRGKQKDIVLPPEENEDNCLEKLRNLARRFNRLPKVISEKYYTDTYLNAGELAALPAGYARSEVDRVMESEWNDPLLERFREPHYCYWVKRMQNLVNVRNSSKKDIVNLPERTIATRTNQVIDGIEIFFTMSARPTVTDDKKYIIARFTMGISGQFPVCTFDILAENYQDIRQFIVEAVS